MVEIGSFENLNLCLTFLIFFQILWLSLQQPLCNAAVQGNAVFSVRKTNPKHKNIPRYLNSSLAFVCQHQDVDHVEEGAGQADGDCQIAVDGLVQLLAVVSNISF